MKRIEGLSSPASLLAIISLGMGLGAFEAQAQYAYTPYGQATPPTANYANPHLARDCGRGPGAAYNPAAYDGSYRNSAAYNGGAAHQGGAYSSVVPGATNSGAGCAPQATGGFNSYLPASHAGAAYGNGCGYEAGCYGSGVGQGLGQRLGGGACWTAEAGVIFLSVLDQDHYNFSFDDANESLQYTNAKDADINYATGIEARLVRQDACSCSGVELVYWGLFSADASTSTLGTDVTGNLNGILNWDQLDYNGASADNNVNNASIHRVSREVQVHNVEFNRFSWFTNMGQQGLKVQFLGGFRYFHFSDNLQFASDPDDTAFNGDVDELFYGIDAENNLIGFQLGTLAEYRVSRKFLLTVGAKAGIYNNHASAYSRIFGTAGTATINNGPNNGIAFSVNSTKNDIAMLGEFNLGAAYQINNCWRANFGYRVVGVSGVATPTNQIFADLRGIQDVRLLANNGSLILHGFTTSVEKRF